MPELIEAYWPYILIAFVIGLAVAWFVLVANRKTSVVSERKDVLDEGAEKAKRNQALIDPPPGAEELSNVANTQEVAHAGATADAEAGPAITPSKPDVAEATTAPSAESGQGDDLTRIKGLGPKLSAMLGTMGVTRFDQIAAWDEAEIDRVDSKLGRFQGRIRRDDWVTQAKLLAAGDEGTFSEHFGQNG